HRSVMDAAGMEPDREVPETSASARQEPPPPTSSDDANRLSVFKDFIDKLDIDKPDKDKPDAPAT
ncbi:MAG: hypothetical protein KJZ72_17485, partial [Anaerolineales bacterium]|nr:hypothetical protein [Anaerolineales bacterium]